MLETLNQVALDAADALIGPHALVPWWGTLAWLAVLFGGMLGGALAAKTD